jgi:hypothetical protein
MFGILHNSTHSVILEPYSEMCESGVAQQHRAAGGGWSGVAQQHRAAGGGWWIGIKHPLGGY